MKTHIPGGREKYGLLGLPLYVMSRKHEMKISRRDEETSE